MFMTIIIMLLLLLLCVWSHEQFIQRHIRQGSSLLKKRTGKLSICTKNAGKISQLKL